MAEAGTLKMRLTLDDAMSNAELAAAINVAHEKHYASAPHTYGEKLWLHHLTVLLEIQRARAASCSFVKEPNRKDQVRDE